MRKLRTGKPKHPQPMQPLVMTRTRVLRFQSNVIVEYIVNCMTSGRPLPDYNTLMAMPWPSEDVDQFNMLHGYSVSGLPYRTRRAKNQADAASVSFLFSEIGRSK